MDENAVNIFRDTLGVAMVRSTQVQHIAETQIDGVSLGIHHPLFCGFCGQPDSDYLTCIYVMLSGHLTPWLVM